MTCGVPRTLTRDSVRKWLMSSREWDWVWRQPNGLAHKLRRAEVNSPATPSG